MLMLLVCKKDRLLNNFQTRRPTHLISLGVRVRTHVLP